MSSTRFDASVRSIKKTIVLGVTHDLRKLKVNDIRNDYFLIELEKM